MNEEETKVEVTGTEEVKAEETVTETSAEETVAEEVKEEAPATEEAAPAEKQEVDLKELFAGVQKNLKWIVIGVAALILICIIGSCAANSGSRFTTQDAENVYYQVGLDSLMTMEGDEVSVDEGISTLTTSADQSLTVIKDGDATLFVVDGTELVEVAQEVNYFVISNYGDTIAYITDKEDGVGTLYLYNVSKKKSVEIDDEVYAGDIILSADGKSVAYITDCDVEEGWFSSSVTGNVYVSKNGKEGEQVAKNSVPLAVTDGGKHVFYIKENEKLYMDDEKLGSNINSKVYFNEDYTELIFNEDDAAKYFTVKMKEPVKVKKGTFTSLYTPANVVLASTRVNSNGSYTVYSYGVDSFNETLWCIDSYEAYYVYDKGEETEKLNSYLTQYQMSANGKSMLYLDGGQLVLVDNIEKSRDGETVAYGLYYMESFSASEDFKDIYYYNYEEDELCYLKKGESVRIADDADTFVYSDKYGVVFFIEDDELFYASKTAKSKKEVCGEEVSGVYVLDGEVFFTRKDDDVYSLNKMKSKAKYEAVYELDVNDLFK